MNAKRLTSLHAYISSLPASEVKLSFFHNGSKDAPCGCALGYAAYQNMFGMFLDSTPSMLVNQPVNKETMHHGLVAAKEVFDLGTIHEAIDLFSMRNSSKYDTRDVWGLNDKEVWLHRFDCFMAEHGIRHVDPEAPTLLLSRNKAQ